MFSNSRYCTCTVRQSRVEIKVKLTAILFVTAVILTYVNIHWRLNVKTENISKVNGHHVIGHKCPDVLSNMTTGRWFSPPPTIEQENSILKFLTNTHVRFRFPENYQRRDRLCGNVTHTGSKIATFFRALCDPEGPTPCCFHNKCVMKAIEECVCKDCYDMRNMKHAEYSSWIPSHPGCPYKDHSPQEACRILQGSSIIFAGDSVLRHIYIALLLIITGDREHGALFPMIDKDVRQQCSGMYMFTEKDCRKNLIEHYKVCQGSAELLLKYCCDHNLGYNFQRISESLWKPRSMLIAGIGIHMDYNFSKVINDFLRPLLAYLDKRRNGWPKLLWVEDHAPGILKSPKLLTQTYSSVKEFNTKIKLFLRRNKVSILQTFNLTDGMMSFDGEHYGIGVNIVKANLLLSYIDELKRNGLW